MPKSECLTPSQRLRSPRRAPGFLCLELWLVLGKVTVFIQQKIYRCYRYRIKSPNHELENQFFRTSLLPLSLNEEVLHYAGRMDQHFRAHCLA